MILTRRPPLRAEAETVLLGQLGTRPGDALEMCCRVRRNDLNVVKVACRSGTAVGNLNNESSETMKLDRLFEELVNFSEKLTPGSR